LHSYRLQPDAASLVQLRNHGISPEYLRDTTALGYDFTTDELIQLKNHGVDRAYLERLRDSGMRRLTAEQITKLKTHGVN
jgi:hypothetical protein